MISFNIISVLFQLMINGVLLGATYGIAAIGLSLILGTMQIVFLAQGTMIILAAYGSFWLFKLLGMDPYLSMIIVIPVCMIIGAGVYQGLFRKVSSKGKFPSLLIAFGLMTLIENVMFVGFTGNTRALQTSYAAYAFDIFGMNISFVRLMVLLMVICGTMAVYFFLKKTLYGKAVLAASENLEYAMLVGITPHLVNTLAFALGMGLAGLAGVAVATTYAFDPFSGFVFSLKAMIALALGGMGTVAGALLGGLLLGMVESYGSFFLDSGWTDVIAYAVFLFILMFKPEGLFNRDRSLKS